MTTGWQEDAIVAQNKSDSGKSSTENQTLSCLLVDDDAIDTRYVSWLLQQANGFDLAISSARSLDEAVNIAANNSFDLYLLDYWMGEETSIDFIEQLIGGNRDAKTVVVMSSLDDETFREGSLRAGADLFIAKQDLSKATLEGMLRNVIQIASKTRSGRAQKRLDEEKIAEWTRYLNNRLDQAHGFATLALSAAQTEKAENSERLIKGALEHLGELRHEVSYIALGLSALKRRGDVNLAPFDISLLLSEVVDDIQFEADQHGKTVSFDDQITDSVILSDPALVSQLVSILLRGSVQFSPDGADISVRYNLTSEQLEITISEFGNKGDQTVDDYQFGTPSPVQLADLFGKERTGSFLVSEHLLQLLGGRWSMGKEDDRLEIICTIPLNLDLVH